MRDSVALEPRRDDDMDTTIANKDERTLGLVAHLLFFAGANVPFGNVIGPLILWQMKKDESSFVAEHAKESLNFQLTCMILAFVCLLLCLIVIGFFLLIALVVFQIVYVSLAAASANEGRLYRYPLTFRFVS